MVTAIQPLNEKLKLKHEFWKKSKESNQDSFESLLIYIITATNRKFKKSVTSNISWILTDGITS